MMPIDEPIDRSKKRSGRKNPHQFFFEQKMADGSVPYDDINVNGPPRNRHPRFLSPFQPVDVASFSHAAVEANTVPKKKAKSAPKKAKQNLKAPYASEIADSRNPPTLFLPPPAFYPAPAGTYVTRTFRHYPETPVPPPPAYSVLSSRSFYHNPQYPHHTPPLASHPYPHLMVHQPPPFFHCELCAQHYYSQIHPYHPSPHHYHPPPNPYVQQPHSVPKHVKHTASVSDAAPDISRSTLFTPIVKQPIPKTKKRSASEEKTATKTESSDGASDEKAATTTLSWNVSVDPVQVVSCAHTSDSNQEIALQQVPSQDFHNENKASDGEPMPSRHPDTPRPTMYGVRPFEGIDDSQTTFTDDRTIIPQQECYRGRLVEQIKSNRRSTFHHVKNNRSGDVLNQRPNWKSIFDSPE